jgi:diguanylate cyclase (GGDEF)-like protein
MVTTAPFGDCELALLQQAGRIQSYGALIAVDANTHLIEYCSTNVGQLLGHEPRQLLGRTGAQRLGTAWPALLRLASEENHFKLGQFSGAQPLTAIGHRRGAYLLLEFEPAAETGAPWWTHETRVSFLDQLAAGESIAQWQDCLLRWVHERSGFDRVMLYRFLPEWHGVVAAERCSPGMQRVLGLRFPASDIPPNARELYTQNWERLISDVDAPAASVIAFHPEAPPLDLTHATLRAVHPVHIQYLKNMAVRASFSLSLVVNGKLWGLIACHHRTPRMMNIEDRLSLEEIAKLASLHLRNLLGRMERDSRSVMRSQLSRLQGAMVATGQDAKLGLSHGVGVIRESFDASGAWLSFEGEDIIDGAAPDALSLEPLREWLRALPREEVSQYHTLPQVLESDPALAAKASGLMLLPLAGTDFVAFMRPEVVQTIQWAGRPACAEDHSRDDSPNLSPRASFARWAQELRNTAERWTDIQIEFAGEVRQYLLDFITKTQLEKVALYDPLTGAANRMLFERRLRQEVRNALMNNSAFALHMLDLDRFKPVNDTLGHATGDKLLKVVAQRLTRVVRAQDTVARMGGDEFAVIQTGMINESGAALMAEKIVNAISEPYLINGERVNIGVSVGFSICPVHTAEERELLEYADLALYQVKRTGRNAYAMFHPRMRTARADSSDSAGVLRALENDEFRMSYQPIVDAGSGQLRGLEAFLRWRRGADDERAACEFLPLIEQMHLATAVDEWVMNAVFEQFAHWQKRKLPTVPITINISHTQFATQDLLGQIKLLAARYQLGWHWLRLDIKEQTVVADVAHAIRSLRGLRDSGVAANLDNFGQGLVPMGHLSQLPFGGVKLDALLLENIGDREYFDSFFNIVQGIARVLHAELTVTRVEREQMRQVLAGRGPDLLQGNAIGPLCDAKEAEKWLRGSRLVAKTA